MALAKESPDSPSRPFIIAALGGEALRDFVRSSSSAGDRYIALSQLARIGTGDDLALLWTTVDDSSADVRVASALAILRITASQPQTKQP